MHSEPFSLSSEGNFNAGDPRTRIVGSLTHGVVANNAFSAEIDTALGALVTGGDTAKFTDAVKKAYDANK